MQEAIKITKLLLFFLLGFLFMLGKADLIDSSTPIIHVDHDAATNGLNQLGNKIIDALIQLAHSLFKFTGISNYVRRLSLNQVLTCVPEDQRNIINEQCPIQPDRSMLQPATTGDISILADCLLEETGSNKNNTARLLNANKLMSALVNRTSLSAAQKNAVNAKVASCMLSNVTSHLTPLIPPFLNKGLTRLAIDMLIDLADGFVHEREKVKSQQMIALKATLCTVHALMQRGGCEFGRSRESSRPRRMAQMMMPLGGTNRKVVKVEHWDEEVTVYVHKNGTEQQTKKVIHHQKQATFDGGLSWKSWPNQNWNSSTSRNAPTRITTTERPRRTRTPSTSRPSTGAVPTTKPLTPANNTISNNGLARIMGENSTISTSVPTTAARTTTQASSAAPSAGTTNILTSSSPRPTTTTTKLGNGPTTTVVAVFPTRPPPLPAFHGRA